MPFYFIEEYKPGFGLNLQIEKILHVEQSRYQHIVVFKTMSHGVVMVLDGYIMTTELDEFYYHETLVHPPMHVASDPRRVLIIGGGDGGSAREVLRYASVEKVDMVEIDGRVVEVSKKYMPGLSSSLNDPRLALHIENGVRFVRECDERYDVIIVDSTDPIGPAIALFSEPFYRNCCRILSDDGAFAAQSESPLYQIEGMQPIYRNLRRAFPRVCPYFGPVPSYGGQWSYALATKGKDPAEPEKREPIPGLRYYNESVHRGLFHLPNNLKEIVGGD
ncbi:MAG: polyamine aminopropyltransferase [Candidatus Glassbacteria bacterium]